MLRMTMFKPNIICLLFKMFRSGVNDDYVIITFSVTLSDRDI